MHNQNFRPDIEDSSVFNMGHCNVGGTCGNSGQRQPNIARANQALVALVIAAGTTAADAVAKAMVVSEIAALASSQAAALRRRSIETG
jgi:hypothetical protein